MLPKKEKKGKKLRLLTGVSKSTVLAVFIKKTHLGAHLKATIKIGHGF
jgi:hypothetical protein